jgi:endo-1,4-beta-xylanase
MSPQPAYERLMQLIKGNWWSGEQTLKTDANGAVKFQGILGDYELATPNAKAKFSLDQSEKLELTLPGHKS